MKKILHSTNKQIESIINWRMRTYKKEKALKSAEKIFAQHRRRYWINYKLENEDLCKRKGGKRWNFVLHSIDKQIESIINWRMRPYEKEKAVKRAEKFFAQHRQTNWINYELENEDLRKEKAVKSSEKVSAQHRQTESFINWRMRTYEKEKAVKSAENFFCTA